MNIKFKEIIFLFSLFITIIIVQNQVDVEYGI